MGDDVGRQTAENIDKARALICDMAGRDDEDFLRAVAIFAGAVRLQAHREQSDRIHRALSEQLNADSLVLGQ